MFDIGFYEIALICVVALLVVGPERLPGLVRELARWTRTIRRFVTTTRREFESQLSSLEQNSKIIDPLPKSFDEALSEIDELADIAPDKQDRPIKEEQSTS